MVQREIARFFRRSLGIEGDHRVQREVTGYRGRSQGSEGDHRV